MCKLTKVDELRIDVRRMRDRMFALADEVYKLDSYEHEPCGGPLEDVEGCAYDAGRALRELDTALKRAEKELGAAWEEDDAG